MGQAKLRGTLEQRAFQAKEKAALDAIFKANMKRMNAEAELVRVSRMSEKDQDAYWAERKRKKLSCMTALALVAGMALPFHRPRPVSQHHHPDDRYTSEKFLP